MRAAAAVLTLVSLGAVPACPGAVPACPGAKPGCPGAVPACPGAVPACPGAVPACPGETSVEEGYERGGEGCWKEEQFRIQGGGACRQDNHRSEEIKSWELRK